MRPRYEWVLAALAIAVASVAGFTCSASGNGARLGSGASGEGGGSTNTNAGGSGGTFAGSGGGGFTIPHECIPETCSAAGGTCEKGTCVVAENPGGIDAATQEKLEAGGNADGSFRWLYPYDKTVFPRGLLAPTLQFDGAPPDAVYLRISSAGLSYSGFHGPSNPGRAKLSEPIWTALTALALGADTIKVEVTKISGGQVSGPIAETWKIAPGNMRGTIYYETYGSEIAGGVGSVGIMKIGPGASKPEVVRKGCGNTCHTASADGSTLVSATSLTASSSFDLKTNATPLKKMQNNAFTYGGLYPDGSFLVSSTHHRTWAGLKSLPSRLYDTKTGAKIPTPSWDDAVKNGGTPAFAPDGKWIAFNPSGNGASLSVMAFDKASMSFSGLTPIAQNAGLTLAWPAFTADSKWVVYQAGTNKNFETNDGARGNLFAANVATKALVRLDALDGYLPGGATYLPANDPRYSFAPTMLPEPVGGYFWVVFTSHRSYGNTRPSLDGDGTNGKLWVAAFDLNPQPGADPSHPAFFLDGQELDADNLRGFWVLNPCLGDGEICTSGDQCCGGYCQMSEVGGRCASTTNGCANEFEKCEKSADCCEDNNVCVNGRCALAQPH